MRAINHALTGAVIGLAIPTPLLAVPLAFVSHFICDAIPHHGTSNPSDTHVASKKFAIELLLDAVACLILVLLLAIVQPTNWLLAAVCAFLAASPDLFTMPAYIRVRRGGGMKDKQNTYTKFAKAIQWFERPIGAVVEIAWFIATTAILLIYLTV